jgi:hypothetical protein
MTATPSNSSIARFSKHCCDQRARQHRKDCSTFSLPTLTDQLADGHIAVRQFATQEPAQTSARQRFGAMF